MSVRRFVLGITAATAATVATLGGVELAVRLISDPRPEEVLEQRRAFPAFFPLAEAGLFVRDPDPELRYRLAPGFEMILDGRRYAVNSSGFRGDETVSRTHRDGAGIVLLGDSYAFGLGVDQTRTLARQLEDRIDASGRRSTVLNLGVPGYQTGQELALARKLAFDLDPDLVILLYYGNDQVKEAFHWDPAFRVLYGDALPLPYSLKGVLAHSAAYRRVARIHINRLRIRGELSPLGERHWPVTRRRLEQLADLCTDHGVPLVIANLPALWSSAALRDSSWPGHWDYDRVGALAEELGLPWIDLRASLLATRRSPDDDFLARLVVSPVPPIDHHLNEHGVGVVADAVAAGVIDRVWAGTR